MNRLSGNRYMTLETSLGDIPQSVNIILASTSPRRRDLIKILDLNVEVRTPLGVETPPYWRESPEEYVLRLSFDKANEISNQVPRAIVIGADTVVEMNNNIFCKPLDRRDAKTMLQKLGGHAHTVFTGVTALDGRTGIWKSSVTSTKVHMRKYSEKELDTYVDTGRPFDKAGGYAIQDLQFNPVNHIQGCYLNVIGFPICEVMTLIKNLGVNTTLKESFTPPEQCQDCALIRM